MFHEEEYEQLGEKFFENKAVYNYLDSLKSYYTIKYSRYTESSFTRNNNLIKKRWEISKNRKEVIAQLPKPITEEEQEEYKKLKKILKHLNKDAKKEIKKEIEQDYKNRDYEKKYGNFIITKNNEERQEYIKKIQTYYRIKEYRKNGIKGAENSLGYLRWNKKEIKRIERCYRKNHLSDNRILKNLKKEQVNIAKFKAKMELEKKSFDASLGQFFASKRLETATPTYLANNEKTKTQLPPVKS